MKFSSKLLIVFFLLIIACGEGNETKVYSTDILQNYNWEVVSVAKDGRIVATLGQPFPTLHVETDVITFSGDSEGNLFRVVGEANYLLGDWHVNGKTLTLDGQPVTLTKLNKKDLMYVTADKYTVHRRAIAK